MSRRVLSAEERKQRLDDAREAIKSRDVQLMRLALQNLPEEGYKASLLRGELEARLRPTVAVVAVEREAAEGHAFVDGAHNYVVSQEAGGNSDLITVKVRGGQVEVAVNQDHAAFVLLQRPDGSLQSGSLLLLAAWAALEVESGTEKKRERVADLRTDWARLVTRFAKQAGAK